MATGNQDTGPRRLGPDLVRRGRRRADLRRLAVRARSTTSPREAELGGAAGIRRRPARCALGLGWLLALFAGVALGGGAADGAGAGHHDRHVGDGRGGIAKRKIGSFDAPTYVTHAPGAPGLLYVVERAGTVRGARATATLGPALPRHPRPGHHRRRAWPALDRLRPPLRAQPTSSTPTTRTATATSRSTSSAPPPTRQRPRGLAPEGDRHPPPGPANHNGGQLQFGPDGKLYAGTGDGGGGGDPPENAQNKHELLGKLLRIDPHKHGSKPYRVAARQPVRRQARAQNEIYALGLRNPYRFSFDRGRILIGDVGQDRCEEVDYENGRERSGAPTSAGTTSRATTASTTPATTRRRGPATATSRRSSSTAHGRTAAARSSAATSSATAGCRSLVRPLPVRGPLRRRPAQLRPAIGAAAGATAASASTFDARAPSARAPKGHLYVASLDGPVYRLVHK